MLVSAVLPAVVRFLLPPALISTIYIYYYPVIHGCEFPEPPLRKSEPDVCYLNPRQGPGKGAGSLNDAVPRPGGGLWGLGKQVAHTWDELNSDGKNLIGGRKAPFRLLALGDPQLEGDTSLPDPNEPNFPSLQQLLEKQVFETNDDDSPFKREIMRCTRILELFRDLVVKDVPRLAGIWRKQLDLWGNDYYLGHVYRSMKWWTRPSHVTVLGDLVGSQWIDDDEFEWRGWRYWNRVFTDGLKVEDSIALGDGSDEPGEDIGADAAWENRIINVAGNHDIGYAGEIDTAAIDRFQKQFGRVNWDRWFRLSRPPPSNDDIQTSSPLSPFDTATPNSAFDPAIRVLILNAMNLDGPVYSPSHQTDTYSFINNVISTSRPVDDPSVLTILLTHVPLHKRDGICVDGPYFSYYDDNAGLLREQNHLSEFASHQVLQSIFGMSGNREAPGAGMGRKGIILDGHDHEGCDVWHYFNRSSAFAIDAPAELEAGEWAAVPYPIAHLAKLPISSRIPGIREVTVRSMMGSYGGNAGLLSAWYEEPVEGAPGVGEWKVEYAACPFVVQHVWWAVHIVDLALLGLILATGVACFREWWSRRQSQDEKEANRKELAKPKELGCVSADASVDLRANRDIGKGNGEMNGQAQNGSASHAIGAKVEASLH